MTKNSLHLGFFNFHMLALKIKFQAVLDVKKRFFGVKIFYFEPFICPFIFSIEGKMLCNDWLESWGWIIAIRFESYSAKSFKFNQEMEKIFGKQSVLWADFLVPPSGNREKNTESDLR